MGAVNQLQVCYVSVITLVGKGSASLMFCALATQARLYSLPGFF